MPVYTYRCSDGHEQDRVFKFEDRPDSVKCGCGLGAKRIFSVRKTPAVAHSEALKVRQERWSGTAWHEFVCEAGHSDLIEVDFKAGEMTGPRRCASCGGTARVRYQAKIDRFSERFPYYDRGLGCWVKSKKDRLQKAAARGLEPVDGDMDFAIDAAFRREDDEREADERYLAEVHDKYENHPAYADYRKARDQGLVG